MATMRKPMKAQVGKMIGKAIKGGLKNVERGAVKKIEDSEIKNAFRSMERDRLKKMFQKIDAEEASKKPGMKKGGAIKKAQKGMTMKQLKMKYPSVDTTAKGDVRGIEMNAYAPKKVLQKYNDTYNAFDRKFGNKPAKDKKGGVVKKAKMGTKMTKMSKKK
jgi:hypothetical protein